MTHEAEHNLSNMELVQRIRCNKDHSRKVNSHSFGVLFRYLALCEEPSRVSLGTAIAFTHKYYTYSADIARWLGFSSQVAYEIASSADVDDMAYTLGPIGPFLEHEHFIKLVARVDATKDRIRTVWLTACSLNQRLGYLEPVPEIDTGPYIERVLKSRSETCRQVGVSLLRYVNWPLDKILATLATYLVTNADEIGSLTSAANLVRSRLGEQSERCDFKVLVPGLTLLASSADDYVRSDAENLLHSISGDSW